MFYVYKVTCKKTGFIYIGKTKNVPLRWTGHVSCSRRGSHLPMHAAIREYGPDAFEVVVLSEHSFDEEALLAEAVAIDEVPLGLRYNISSGGIGGNTMTASQLDAQRAIKSSNYGKFVELFEAGYSATRIAKEMCASTTSVTRCAHRLGLSFLKRQRAGGTRRLNRARIATRPESKLTEPKSNGLLQKASESKPVVVVERSPSGPKFASDADRSRFRAEVAARVNKARGIPKETQDTIWDLYLQHYTAQQVAEIVSVPKATVRGVVNRRYKTLSDDERAQLKREHGSLVRTGVRNPRHKLYKDTYGNVDRYRASHDGHAPGAR